MIKKGLSILAAFTLCIGMAGCGAANQSTDSAVSLTYSNSKSVEYGNADMAEGGVMADTAGESLSLSQGTGTTAGVAAATTSTTSIMSQEKMVYRTYLNEETLNFDETYAAVKELLNKNGCIIANENVSNDGNSYMSSGYRSSRNGYVTERQAYMEIRVPAANYNLLLENIVSVGNVISKETTATNITRNYNDTMAELAAYEEEYAQLQKLMEMSGNMSDILEVSNQMTSVRSRINQLKSLIQNMDNDVAYSYIYLTLTEVVEYTQPETTRVKKTFWDRLKNTVADSWNGFLSFCEGLLFLIIELLPYAIIAAIIVLIYLKTPLHRRRKECRELKKAKKSSQITAPDSDKEKQ